MYSRPHIVIPFNKGLPIRSVVQPLFLCDALETWPWQCFLPCMFCGDDRYPSGCGTLARVYLSSLVIDDVHCLHRTTWPVNLNDVVDNLLDDVCFFYLFVCCGTHLSVHFSDKGHCSIDIGMLLDYTKVKFGALLMLA